jgi:alpha-D-ribose 1-methylphosphonate 5-triphosphate synthase subunit PhnL
MRADSETVLEVEGLAKTFVLHNQGGVELPVLRNVALKVEAGECVVLDGPSGSGKSTLLKSVYGNYRASAGTIRVRHHDDWIDIAAAEPREVLAVRRDTLGYVSQFLRVIPRVPALDVVADPLLRRGVGRGRALERAAELLQSLNVPERLWRLPPATFSGGEQQRVNIAHGLIGGHPLLLVDEPTAALDAGNRQVVVELIRQACREGAAALGIFHDAEVRDAVATRRLDMAAFH